MNRRVGRIGIGFGLAVVSLLVAAQALAQNVELKLPKGPHYAGDAIELQLVVTGFEEEPTPEVDVEVAKAATLQSLGVSPNVNQQIQIVNGRMTSSRTVTFVYRYLLTASTPGRISVGPFVVRQGKEVRRVPATPLQIGKIAASNEVSISLNLPKGPFYVGQHVPVKLRFELTRALQKSLENYSLGVPLFMKGEGVRFVDHEPRGDTLTDIVIQTPKGPVELKGVVREVQVANKPGLSVEVERTLIPTESGIIDAAPVTIVAEKATRWRRDLFGQRIASQTKKLRAAGRGQQFEVRQVPTQGRPPSFAGAVGKDFTLDVSAERSVVKVGEPISIELVLRGEGALESASLPRLDAPGLLRTERFRVPDENPTGVIEEDGSKRFRVTVRVLDEQVDALPALEYSWFDPEAGGFATTHSRPIALSVAPGRTIGADDVVGVSPEPDSTSSPVPATAGDSAAPSETETSGRVFDASGADLSIETDVAVLTTADGATVSFPALAFLYAVGVALAVGGGWAGRRKRRDPRMAALQRSLGTELAQVQAVVRASDNSAQETARELAAAIRRMHALVPEAAPSGLDGLLGELDALAYAPAAEAPTLDAGIAERAVGVARELAATPFEATGERGVKRFAAFVVFLAGFATSPADAFEANDLARDALAAYAAAQEEPLRDRRAAAFAQAEQLFAALAGEVPDSAALQTNLGNAALQAHHPGVAVLSYKRALRLDPSHAQAERNLQHARSLLPGWVPRPAPIGAADSLFFWHTRLSRPARTVAAAVAFTLAGAAFGAAAYWRRRDLRACALVLGVIWIAVTASLAAEGRNTAGAAGVLLAEEAIARTSDSAFAPSALAEPLPAGTELRVLEERGSWLQARLANGREVWLRSSGVARVAPAVTDEEVSVAP